MSHPDEPAASSGDKHTHHHEHIHHYEPPAPHHGASAAVTGWAELGNGDVVELASPGARVGARILDAIVIVIAMVVVLALGSASAAGGSGEAAAAGFFAAILIAVAFGLLYEVVQIALWGQTLGKRMTSVKVVHAVHGGTPGWGKSTGRWAIPGLLGLIPFIGWLLALICYLSLLWDRVRQGWHDKAAGTLVVRV